MCVVESKICSVINWSSFVVLQSISLQNLPRDALPDGSPVREKLANFKRPKKYKTSENDFSHGSFFLRIGGISKYFLTHLNAKLSTNASYATLNTLCKKYKMSVELLGLFRPFLDVSKFGLNWPKVAKNCLKNELHWTKT